VSKARSAIRPLPPRIHPRVDIVPDEAPPAITSAPPEPPAAESARPSAGELLVRFNSRTMPLVVYSGLVYAWWLPREAVVTRALVLAGIFVLVLIMVVITPWFLAGRLEKRGRRRRARAREAKPPSAKGAAAARAAKGLGRRTAR
jgi:hypothetical protein